MTTASGYGWVLYVEVRGEAGPDIRAGLLGLLDRLRLEPGYRGAELLDSPAQPDLHLLAVRWAGEPPALPLSGQVLPPGARHWSFRVRHHEVTDGT